MSLWRFPLLVVTVLALAASASSATLRVDVNGNGDFTAIQPALDAAAAGDIVLVAPGEYVITAPLSFNRLLDPEDSGPVKDLKLTSEAGPSDTIVRIEPQDPLRASVIIFERGESRASTVDGFRLTGGKGTRWESLGPAILGGGILCVNGSSPTLRDLTVLENTADVGGGLYCDDSSAPSLSSCTLRRNRAAGEGGAVFADGDLRLANCVIAENFAESTGGIFTLYSQVELVHCTITGNASQAGVGGVRSAGTPCRIRSSILWGNAGGSLESDDAGVPQISHSLVEGPEPPPGAGNLARDPLFCGWGEHADVHVDDSYPYRGEGTTSRPYSDLQHAAGFNLGLAASSPCLGTGEGGSDMGADRGTCAAPGAPRRRLRLAAGRYEVGMLVLGSGRVTIEGAGAGETAIVGSIAGLRTGDDLARLAVTEGPVGGVLVSRDEAPVLADCELADNLGPGLDAAYNASPELSRCTIARNRAPAGGVLCREESQPYFADCTIRDNVGDWAGGAFCASRSSPIFLRCVFVGNVGPTIGYSGDKPSIIEPTSPTLEHCTIAGNYGPPLHCHGSHSGSCAIEIKSCIIWHNDGPFLQPSELPGAVVSSSDIESVGAWPGPGNIDREPRFCGWDVGSEVFVAAGTGGPGTGTAEDPFPDFSWAASYSLALTAGSPCIGAGENGADMGAPSGACAGPGGPLRTVHLAPGEYPRIPRSVLLEQTSVEGAGAAQTAVRGPVEGLGYGSRLAGVTVTGSDGAGIVIAAGEGPRIEDCVIAGNRGDGVVTAASDPYFLRCSIRENAGHGVLAQGGRFEGSTIASNVGAGVRTPSGSVSFVRCEMVGNGGSGVEAGESVCALDRCRVAGNALDGCATEPYALLLLRNCLVYANGGGGVPGGFKASLDVVSSTVAANAGVGLRCPGGVSGSISWGNRREQLCSPSGDNLYDRDPLFLDPGVFDFARFRAAMIVDQTYQLPDFILDEPDYRLQPGSPAIDAVDPEGLPDADFAGHARPCGLATDVGAFEMGDCVPRGEPFVRGDVDIDGELSLADAVVILQHLFLGGPAPGCLESADLNDSGGIDIADPVYELTFLFAGGAPPAPPFSECGLDPTTDQLPCVRSALCSR